MGVSGADFNRLKAFSFARAERRDAAKKKEPSKISRETSSQQRGFVGTASRGSDDSSGARRAAGGGWSPRTSLDALVRSAEALRSICAALDLMAGERGRPARVFGGTTRPHPLDACARG